jgi:rhodanese-related sulfurtransferase
MTVTQIIVYSIIVLVALFYLRRLILVRRIGQYTSSQVAQKLNDRHHFLLLDVQTDSEHRSHHIKGAVHIPLQTLRRRAEELNKYRNREIICYCRSGSRSLTAALQLHRLGYTAGNMKGGLAEWNFLHNTN